MYNPQGFQKFGSQLIPPAVIFHLVNSDVKDRLSIEPEEFEHFLDCMAGAGLQSISLHTYWEILHRQDDRKIEDCYILTFDDGYDCFTRYALPILQKYGAECTLYIPSSYPGQWNTWNPKIPFNGKHMDWPEIREAVSAGVEIGSHGSTHRSFKKLALPEIEHELLYSKQIIEDHISQRVSSFAYPYGDCFPQSDHIVSKLYNTAVSVEEGGRVWPEDQYRIKRYDYQELMNMVSTHEA